MNAAAVGRFASALYDLPCAGVADALVARGALVPPAARACGARFVNACICSAGASAPAGGEVE
ncbi:hypothetical protein FHW12_002151 [Dokdonella fugitiva]|uniref:Uncharacterized protein n=1 Tax=Dokdonella fugitiva TaxID=328517 RepID=A0A839ETV3_9GAMM|nr:hypothetical protein [Dokdonella fugitiva]MBA8887927.1 hypothetical protein [Dokdonella fugitiva]